jgi:hypothetical protein
LGDEIVRRLGLESSTDTLGRWMAHRVAELVEEGTSDESAREDAADLILRCWDRRRSWTSGWPRPGLEDVFSWVERDVQVQSEAGWPDDEWTRRLVEVRRSLDEEFRLWARLAVAEERPTVPNLDDAGYFDDELDTDEERAARLLARLVQSADRTFESLDATATTRDRGEVVRAKISDLGSRRAELLDELIENAPPPMKPRRRSRGRGRSVEQQEDELGRE